MTEVINFYLDMFSDIVAVLDSVDWVILGLHVTFFDLMVSFCALCVVISVFWKGVRK